MVSTGIRAAGTFGLQRSLGSNPSREKGLLRAMGRLWPVPHRSLSIRFPERTTTTEPEPWRWARCFAGGARLSWARVDVLNGLAICRSARRPSRAVEKLRRQQQLRDRAPADRAAPGRAVLDQNEGKEVVVTPPAAIGSGLTRLTTP